MPEGFIPIVVHVPPQLGATPGGIPIVDTSGHRFGQFQSLKPIGGNKIRGVVGEGSHGGHMYVFWLWPTDASKEAIRLWCDDGPPGRLTNQVGTIGAQATPLPDPGGGGQGT